MADTLDLGSSAERCAGSSPVSGTTKKSPLQKLRTVLASLRNLLLEGGFFCVRRFFFGL